MRRSRFAGWRRKVAAVAGTVLVMSFVLPGAAVAVDPPPIPDDPPAGDVTAELNLTKVSTADTVEPGQQYTYEIQLGCQVTAAAGCVDARITDPLPDYVTLVGTPTVSGVPAGDVTVTTDPDGTWFTVDFDEDLGDGDTGLSTTSTATVTVVVQVDDDIPYSADGQPLVNTATATADNALHDDGSATVTPSVDLALDAATTKEITPAAAEAAVGTALAIALTGMNTSNADVDELVINEPADPTATPNPFTYLDLTGIGEVTLPTGATTVQVRVTTDGTTWVDGPVGPPAALPDSVEPGAVVGVQVVFTGDIPPGASASVDLDLAQSDEVLDLADPTTVTNSASTTVTLDDDSATSDVASDDYTITPVVPEVSAGKDFEPDTVHAGDDSVMTLSGTNSSEDTALDTMTITDDPLPDGLTFSGFGDDTGAGIDWPTGADEASVTFTCEGTGVADPLTTDVVDTLPDPPAGCVVTGFVVTFTGDIVPGAVATVPAVVVTADEQDTEELTRTNTVVVDGANGGATATDTTTADLLSIIDRLEIDTSKQVTPSEIPAVPGQDVVMQLQGIVEEFPASTTDAHTIVVQDPADPATDDFWTYFEPGAVVTTPIPADATLTVQYYDATTGEWVDVPGMVDVPGEAIFTEPIPDGIDASGIRFVYESDAGFPPGTTVSPNVQAVLTDDVPNADATYTNCAQATAESPGVTAVYPEDPVCVDATTDAVNPGEGDLIDKAWDVPTVAERSLDEAPATLSWSTAGYSGLDTVEITDVPAPGTTALPASVYDAFDLVRIEPLDDDPWLAFDQVTGVELFRLPAGSVDPSAGEWTATTTDPCATSCDGTFPGYTLTADERATTIAFRLTFAESDTNRGGADAGPTDPPVGSGVARSSGNDRPIHLVFSVRDDLRSDATVPVLSTRTYNATDAGLVRNDAQAQGFVDGAVFLTDTASDTILITAVDLVVDLAKDWTGGPLGIPADDVPQNRYPIASVDLSAHNRTPGKVDTLRIVDPAVGDPFDVFNLVGFTEITDPATVGADALEIVLALDGGGELTYTDRAAALAATEAELVDVVGMTVTYTGRIDADAVVDIGFDTRLRTESRDAGDPPVAGMEITNGATVTIQDLVDYPDVDPKTAQDAAAAEVQTNEQGVEVTTTKTFDPDVQTEPDNGPVTVTLTGQPGGPSRTVRMVLSDTTATFWNQYDFTGFDDLALTAPIEQVRVDALTGGTWSVLLGQPVLSGATWVEGVNATTLALPDGVLPADVQGLRFTFSRVGDANWENPANPDQPVSFEVTRRATLHTGGPVQSDLAGNTAAPGETDPGVATDQVVATVTGADYDVDGNLITATSTATDTILYQHATNSVTVQKTPDGQQWIPGSPNTYTLTVTNDGAVPIVDPVIVDRLPVDALGVPQVVFDPTVDEVDRYAYGLTPESTADDAMPVDPADVTVDEQVGELTFTFPPGTTLQVGETYTISFAMQTAAGLPGGTQFTNEVGVTGDRAWDGCVETLDDETGECRTDATNTVTSAPALGVSKLVRADDWQELGVTKDPAVTNDLVCDETSVRADGFFASPCIPVTSPGGDITWRLTFRNNGNQPLDQIAAIDELPKPGDTGSTNDLARGSEWRPTFTGERPELVLPAEGELAVYWTTDEDPCHEISDATIDCPAGAWTIWPEGDDLPVAPEDVTGLAFVINPTPEMVPLEQIAIDIHQVAPAQSPTAGPDTVAYDTVGAVARSGETERYTVLSEPRRVGVALATGPIRVVKQVDGDAADVYAPDEFTATLECTSLGEEVDLGDAAELTLVPGEPVTVEDLPYGADCTVSEEDQGQSDWEATTVTVERDPVIVPTVRLTNTYDFAELTVSKAVDSTAVDSAGDPVEYGPFTVDVACTLDDEPVYADGYGPDDPMTAELADGGEVTFTELPPDAVCTVTETDTKGAAATTVVTTAGDGDPVTTDGTTGEITLVPTGAGANTAEVTNAFDAGDLVLTKEVTGDAAEFGSGPFTLHVTCTLDDASGTRTTWDDDVVLGGGAPLGARVVQIATGSSCEVTETDAAGATATTIAPEEPVVIDDGTQAVAVTVTNEFRAGGLQVAKTVSGPGASLAAGPYVFDVVCAFAGDDAAWSGSLTVEGVPDEDGRLLSDVVEPLPVGAQCTVTETEDGGADATPDPVTVTIPDVDDEGVATVEVVGVDNPFSAGTVAVTKVVDGTAASLVGDTEFTVRVTCEATDGTTVLDEPVVVQAGDTVVVTDDAGEDLLLPLGTSCWGVETDDGGATESAVDHGSREDAVTVAQSDELQALEITVTNTFDTEVVPPSPTEEPTPSPSPTDGTGPLPTTGADVLPLAVLAGVLGLGGAALLLGRRRLTPGRRD
ncbi:hypothetical protein KIN34_06200 [Cellulomonas sp. DKR-3]|uniref:DUF5979 domain-containing protein n=1 Tax=Cellulomonas fulva TaxID=2835530 RepID=A0ABS5TXN7_9CELL|nr:DUF5979 domain-containing protein [Cellulomonas fulva]MBT0993877.1 hypothetical protein [Cellulomonas fulva]